MRGRDPLALLALLLANGREATVRARGGSMAPALRDGDVLTLAAPGRFRPGDLAAARAGDALVIHRVLREERACLLLRGDACRSADGLFVPLARVVRARRGQRPLRLRRTRLEVALAFAWLRLWRAVSRRWSAPVWATTPG